LIGFFAISDHAFGESASNDIADNKNEIARNQTALHDLTNLDEKLPPKFKNWFGQLSDWLDSSLISDTDFFNALDFLNKHKIIKQNPNGIGKIFLHPKIKKSTVLTIVHFKQPRFNEGAPVVFEGKLTDYLGNPISGGSITIKGDGPCPSNHIIAKGITNKQGGYKIPTITQLWDEKDGLIRTFAEFSGTVDLKPSVSEPQLVIVYKVKGEKCAG
jgi:hypothetical protein